MKRLTMLLVAMLTLAGAMAQNANRMGFFIEGGVGGAIGDTPATALLYKGNNLYLKYAGGTSADFMFGFRLRTSNHWAFDMRIGAMSPIKAIETTGLVMKAMPGMRYTTNELFGNISLYCSVSAGLALSPETDFYNNNIHKGETKIKTDWNYYIPGISYMITAGVNFGNHFYLGPVWDCQYMYNDYSTESSHIHWGMFGVQLGYRF